MGYRSEVVVKFSDNAVKVVKKFYELDKQIKELIDDSEDSHRWELIQAIHWDWIKWYDDDEGIIAFTDMLNQLGDKGYGMIRIGDEMEDIEYYGNTCDFNMYVERNIQW
tara:strand:- start:673 stop:999 length:327 start_codon:yes stop_codon:yes gene_type:complete